MQLTEDSLSFKANGDGVKGHNLYSVQLNFYLPIDPEVSVCKFSGCGKSISCCTNNAYKYNKSGITGAINVVRKP